MSKSKYLINSYLDNRHQKEGTKFFSQMNWIVVRRKKSFRNFAK